MNDIRSLPFHFNVEPLYDSLRANPSIWNQIPYRTNFPSSPHREVDDIWLRYNALEHFSRDGAAFHGPHESVWYPVGSQRPEARKLCFELYKLLDGEQLGGVLLTRVPARKQVYPHVDSGWHARYYEKFIIQIRGTKDQAFHFKGESLSALPGECYWFDNAYSHWVTNPSDEDRISLIVCVRREACLMQ